MLEKCNKNDLPRLIEKGYDGLIDKIVVGIVLIVVVLREQYKYQILCDKRSELPCGNGQWKIPHGTWDGSWSSEHQCSLFLKKWAQ